MSRSRSRSIRRPGALLLALALAAPAAAGEGAPAACYGAVPDVAPTPLEAAVLDAARARAPDSAASPELALAAREIAERVARGEPGALGRAALRLALARACAADPAVSALAVSDVPGRLASHLAAELRASDLSHLGVGVVEQGPFGHAVLLGARRTAALAPFPRDVSPGTVALLRGRLRGLVRPWVVVVGPEELPQEVAVAGLERFEAALSFPRAGRYLVELGGFGQRGPEVAALLVVASGGAALEEPVHLAPPEDPAEPRLAEDRVAAAVNALRARHGLSALLTSEPARAVARRLSADLLARGALAHVLPGGQGLAERLREAAIPARRARENLAAADSALAAQESLEESPAHLANLLDPTLTHLGVGLARRAGLAGGPSVYLTEILLQLPAAGRAAPAPGARAGR